MKKYIVLLVVFFICCGQYLSATEKRDITIAVNAEKDTSIIVRECFKNCKLYGDTYTDGNIKKKYGGDHFDTKNQHLNGDNANIIKRDDNGIYIELKKEFLESKQGNTILAKFYGTYHSSQFGWCASSNENEYILRIKVEKIKEETPEIPATPEISATPASPATPDVIEQIKEGIEHNWGIVLVVALLLFALLYFRQKRLEKKISDLESRKEESNSTNDKNEVDINKIKKSIITELQSGKKLSNDDIKSIVNHPDVKKGINNVVSKIVEEYMQKDNKPVAQNNERTYVGNHTISNTNRPNPIRYRYADFYLDENNTAVVESRDLSDNKEYGMFEIILDDSNMWNAKYTINRSKEKATLEDISILSKYAEIESVPPKFNSIEVIEEGEIQQNGAYWNVTKKIKVRLI